MALGKINHIDITVDDLEKAEEYFTKKLGFKLLRRTEHAGKSIELASPAGDFFFDLHEASQEPYKTWKEKPGVLASFNHIAFKVDDIHKEVEELKGKGVSFRQEDAPVFVSQTGRTVADAADADGHFWIQVTD